MSAASSRSRSSSTTSASGSIRGVPPPPSAGRHDLVGPPEGQHPAALLLVSRHLGRKPAGQQHVRRAQHQPAVLAADAAPLPTRRERHLLQRGRGRARQAGGDGVQGGVAGLGAGRVAGHERAHVVLRGAAQRGNAVQHQVAVGERAGLVQADGVDVGQRLDRVHVLHEHALARQPHGADREGEAHQQHQPLGDHGDDAGGGGRDGLAEGGVVAPRASTPGRRPAAPSPQPAAAAAGSPAARAGSAAPCPPGPSPAAAMRSYRGRCR